MSETIADIIREMRKKADQADFACCGNVDATFVRIFADRIEKAAHNTPTCINCVAVEKWKAKKVAKAEKKMDELVDAAVHTNGLLIKQIKEKDAEIARLRKLVKGLLEASSVSCADCNYDCYSGHSNCIIHDAEKYLEESEVENG